MKNSVEFILARRYLGSKQRIRFINVISLISIAGITVGVAALVVALSVFNGFSGVVTAVLVGFDPHLRIEKRGGMTDQEEADTEAKLRTVAGIRASAPFLSGKAMLVTKGATRVVYIRGIDEERVGGVSGLKEKLTIGELKFRTAGGPPGMAIGIALADHLGIVPGGDLQVISPAGFQSALTGLGQPESRRFTLTGIFDSQNKEYDANFAFVSLESARELFRKPGNVSGIEIRLADFSRADEVKDRLRAILPPEMTVSTWYDLHQTLYRVMAVERWSAYVLLSLIIVVALFNMLGSLTMGVMEKRRDIAVLKTLGMSARRVVRVFMAEGLLIGSTGTALGMVLGLGVLWLQVTYHLFPLDPTVYIIPAIPVEIHWTDFLSTAVASMGLSWVASYYPAKRAAETAPAEALRWE